MSVGIVGGAGFIGSHLYEAIRRRDASCDLVIQDVRALPDGIPASDFCTMDVTDPESVRGKLEGLRVVYYMTGVVGPEHSFESPHRVHRLNVEGALRVLEECVRAGVEQFVYASTVCVFGRADSTPFRENQRPSPDSVYGATKASCEDYLRYIARESAIEVAVLRYPRVVSDSNENVFRAIARRIRNGERIVLTSNGERRFDVVHIEDVIDWNLWFLRHRRSGTFHVTAGFDTCAAEIAQALLARLGSPGSDAQVEYSPVETPNERLLPLSGRLDNRRSLAETGLTIRHADLDAFVRIA